MEVQKRNTDTLNSKHDLSPERFMPLLVPSITKDLTSLDKSIMDELDSYMEDLNGRLIVSRMVTDSVIKGMVNAIEEECAEQISLNNTSEISNVHKELLNHDALSADKYLADQFLITQENSKVNATSPGQNPKFICLTAQSNATGHIEYANRLRVKVEEWIQKLKEERIGCSQADALQLEVGLCKHHYQTDAIHTFHIADINSFETLLAEMSTYLSAVISMNRTLTFKQEPEKDILVDISTTLRNNLTSLHHEYETKIIDQTSLMNDFTQTWQKRSNELATLRQEIDDINISLVSWESGSILNHESLEERSALKRKDQAQRMPSVNNITAHEESSLVAMKNVEFSEDPFNDDSSKLMHMSKAELIRHFKNEMIKMKRQHDAVLQEKTEELFILKREFLKEKGSSHLKKDKEVEVVRKRISETISKLDDILLENENLSSIHVDESLCSLREKLDAILLENQRLLSLLVAKMKDSATDCSKFVNQLPNLCLNVDYIDQIEKLQWDIEALKFEMSIKDAINKSFLLEFYGELGDRVEGKEMETKLDQCIYSFIFGEVVRDAFSRINTFMMKCFDEKKYVSENLLDMEKALSVEVKEKKLLKQQMESSSTLLKHKEMHALRLEAALIHLRQQFDSISMECQVLRDQVINQELVIVESKMESDLIKGSLEENSHQILMYQTEMDKLNQNSKTVSVVLQDIEKQNGILQSELLEIQAKLASKIKEEKEQRKLVESLLTSMSELEYKVKFTMELNESRLKMLHFQCYELSDQARLVKKKFLWYKELFQMRCEDLQKAETEVDLLGDEVDNLVSLLGKIYLSLGHYSSVLQYYPGVMETLKLISREVNVEDSKSL